MQIELNLPNGKNIKLLLSRDLALNNIAVNIYIIKLDTTLFQLKNLRIN